jgi:hypothetical protein
MRLFFSVLISLFVSAVFFFTIKFWGLSQRYIDYNHPFYAEQNKVGAKPLVFQKSNATNLVQNLNSTENLYLDIVITLDQQIAIPLDTTDAKKDYKFRQLNFADKKTPAILLSDYINEIKGKKIILNLIENPVAGPDIILAELKKMGLGRAENFVFTSPYDAQMKDLKEKSPAYLFATTNPEILRIKSMESVYLMEAAVFRSDIVIHPLKFYREMFFTETLLKDLKRRFKRFVNGPIKAEDVSVAEALSPLGIIIQN